MAYYFYIDDMLLPVAPPKVQIKIKNQNKSITLINEGEVNLLKTPGLTEISFDARIPQTVYPFSDYTNGFQPAEYYLDKFEKLKSGKRTFQFIISRMGNKDELLFGTNMSVSLEDYSILEDAKEGFDVIIGIKLKQFRSYGVKKVNLVKAKGQLSVGTTSTKAQAIMSSMRTAQSAPVYTTYTVREAESLWAICKKCLGDGERYREILEVNRDKIKTPNNIQPGTVLKIP